MRRKNEKFSSITQMLKFITGILSWVALVLLVLIAAFLLYYFVSVKVYANKGEEFRPAVSLYTILTESMIPNINPKDVIIDITITNPQDIHVGDVITFVSSASLTKGMTITHRVIDIKVDETGETVYYTQGDANLSPDGAPAKFSNVLGKVLFRIPKLGLLQYFLATKGGWLVIVVIPALIIIISDILKLFRLQMAKNQLVSTLSKEEERKEKTALEKREIEKNLNMRYANRKSREPDPIPKKVYVKMSNGIKYKNTTMELPQMAELPKLRLEKKEEVVEEPEVSFNDSISFAPRTSREDDIFKIDKSNYKPSRKKKKRNNKK